MNNLFIVKFAADKFNRLDLFKRALIVSAAAHLLLYGIYFIATLPSSMDNR